MGSLLSAALPRARCPEEANLLAPELVLRHHLEFIRAGADIIQTNSYGANPVKLGQHTLDDSFEQINQAAVKIAREAREVSGRDILIAGSIGPLGVAAEHLGDTRAGLYGEQARLLEGRGVDLLMLETFTSLEELSSAVAAVRAATSLPLIAQVTVQDDAETITGSRAADVAAAFDGGQVLAVGVNCSLGPYSVLAGLEEMRPATALPLTGQANAGLPQSVEGRIHYPNATPGVLRRVRLARDGSRRGRDRRLLRHHGGACGRHPRGGLGAPVARRLDRPGGAGAAVAGAIAGRGDGAGGQASPRRARAVGRARPAQGRERRAHDRVGQGAGRRRAGSTCSTSTTTRWRGRG